MFGYIDPGTGSLVVQALVAAMIGGGIFFRRFIIFPVVAAWHFVAGRKPAQTAAAEQPQESPAA